MVSQAKQIANQMNAAKSTGPRTDEGKARSSRNRLRHGFFSAAVVLAGEDRTAYDALLEELVAEHRPLTPSEMLCVQRIADCTWKLWRVEAGAAEAHERRAVFVRYEAAQWREDAEEQLRLPAVRDRWLPLWHADREQLHRLRERAAAQVAGAAPAATLAASMAWTVQECAIKPGEFERLQRYEQRLQGMIHRALAELRRLRKERPDVAELPESPYARPSADERDPTEPNQTDPTAPDPTPNPPAGSPSVTLSPPEPSTSPWSPIRNLPERPIAQQYVRNEPTAARKEVTDRPPMSRT
jgi:hypothetical protein